MQSLDLCLGDANLGVLGSLPSLHTSLTRLCLDLKGMSYAAVDGSDDGDGLKALCHLHALRHFSCVSRSLCISEEVHD